MRSRSGAAARTAHVAVRPLPARQYHAVDAGAVLQARFPGIRSTAHAAATPASTWPAGLGMGAPIIADSAEHPNEGRKCPCLQLTHLQYLPSRTLHFDA